MRKFAAQSLLLMTAFVAPNALGAPCAGFTDVDDSSGFCVNVAWMKNRGITLGVTSTLYAPDSPVTRLQMAAFMYRLGFQNALLQGGNAFGATARIGTTDQHAAEIIVGTRTVARFEPRLAPNVILGTAHPPVPATGGNDGVTIGGGHVNTATAGWATISGGNANVAGWAGAVPGGFSNEANGQLSFAAGRSAKANHHHCFVWGASVEDTSCFAANEVVMSGVGGFYFWTAGSSDNTFSGARLAPGTGAWAAYSDRDGKHVVDPVDSRAVLEKLVALPISTWQWKAEPGAVRHMGPMAQDFQAAFGLGDSDKQIVTVDADGVALAAIQGLHARLEATVAAQAMENARLRTELAELRSLTEDVVRLRVGKPLDSATSNGGAAQKPGSLPQ